MKCIASGGRGTINSPELLLIIIIIINIIIIIISVTLWNCVTISGLGILSLVAI
jgi:hypothetical protein